MSDWREDLLTSILNCGYGDLYLLEDCEYDLGEIVDECESQFGKIDINMLVMTMFEFGIRDIDQAIKDRLAELDDIADEEGELSESETEEYRLLEKLEPVDDIKSFHNYIDTSIWIDDKDKIDIYNLYMQDALDRFCEMTGFEISA